MKTIVNPPKNTWEILLQRFNENQADISNTVSEIFAQVKLRGDEALKSYTQQFDQAVLRSLSVEPSEIIEAEESLSNELKQAILKAASNIETFHKSQLKNEEKVETSRGVICWRKSVGIDKVGLYIPGGSAPLFSTVLMLGIPAKIANCKEVMLCSPPDRNGNINPAILFAAKVAGISKIYKVGGAQAIAAMAFGTESISKVYKIFGPGNRFVTTAKEMVQTMGTAIDMPAGPSELLVVADENANAAFVAADLLSQAEHGPDSQVILLSDNLNLIESVEKELYKQLEDLPRKSTVLEALKQSFAVLLPSLEACMELSNIYAPEHLIINCTNASDLANSVQNAGSVFIGPYSSESFGDYASGTNHTLPTAGYAKAFSGVSVDSFIKKITFQEIDKKGLQNLGNTVEIMAEAEGLQAHKNAVSLRLKSLKNG